MALVRLLTYYTLGVHASSGMFAFWLTLALVRLLTLHLALVRLLAYRRSCLFCPAVDCGATFLVNNYGVFLTTLR